MLIVEAEITSKDAANSMVTFKNKKGEICIEDLTLTLLV